MFVALDGELTREVAVKQILDSHADDPASRARFVLEAEITGGLEHPGIVPVYGLGTYGDGRPYYAMRFIRGETLKEAIGHFHGDRVLKNDVGRRSLELRKLLRRFMDVCNAIGYAHSRGVLHRDIKPGNVIVGKHGETLLVDWGLAKATGKSDPSSGERTLLPSSADGSSETLPGSALGTPAYMSPEQAEGNLEVLDRAVTSSVWATLYCLLTGRPPVEATTSAPCFKPCNAGNAGDPAEPGSTLTRTSPFLNASWLLFITISATLFSKTGKPAEALAATEKGRAIRQALADANPRVTAVPARPGDFTVRYRPDASSRGPGGRGGRVPTVKPSRSWNGSPCCPPTITSTWANPRGAGRACPDSRIRSLGRRRAGGGRAGYDLDQQSRRRRIPPALAELQSESALDPLRSRPDFQILLMDLAFPKDPFARGR